MYNFTETLLESIPAEVNVDLCIPKEVDFIKMADRIAAYKKDGKGAGWTNTPWGLANSIKDINKAIRYTFVAIMLRDKDFRVALLDSLLKFGLEKIEVADILTKIEARSSEYKDFITKYRIDESLNEDIEKHNELNPKLWNEDHTLKAEVKEKINKIVKAFTDGLDDKEINYKLDDVKLVGSNCSFNYNKDSDLDIHLVFDLDIYDDSEKQEMAEIIYDYARGNWNKNHTITFYDIPVEIFVETNNTEQLN